MSGGFTLCEYEKVREYCPEFLSTMKVTREELIRKANLQWSPKDFGGLTPGSAQYLETTIMPELFQSGIYNTGVLTTLNTWRSWFSSTTQTIPGHNTIMQGSGASGALNEDYMIGLVGLAFLDKAIRVSEIKMQIADKKLPRVNIEEAMVYNKPAIIFEDGYILDEESSFHLYAYLLSQGPQRIKLIGTQLNRVPNKMQTTNVGAAIS